MNTFYFLSALIQSTDDGLSPTGIIGSLPRDPASIFALVLIVGMAGTVMWFGRPKGGGTNP